MDFKFLITKMHYGIFYTFQKNKMLTTIYTLIASLEIKHSDIVKADYDSLFNSNTFPSTSEVTSFMKLLFITTTHGRLYIYV